MHGPTEVLIAIARSREVVFEYLEIFHNRQCRHTALGMLTPIELLSATFNERVIRGEQRSLEEFGGRRDVVVDPHGVQQACRRPHVHGGAGLGWEVGWTPPVTHVLEG